MSSAGQRPCWGDRPGAECRLFHSKVFPDDIPVFLSVADKDLASGRNIAQGLDIHFSSFDNVRAVVADPDCQCRAYLARILAQRIRLTLVARAARVSCSTWTVAIRSGDEEEGLLKKRGPGLEPGPEELMG